MSLLAVIAIHLLSPLSAAWAGYLWGRRAGFKAALDRVPEATRAGFEAGVGAMELARRRRVIYDAQTSRN